jgi:hypothetical protein
MSNDIRYFRGISDVSPAEMAKVKFLSVDVRGKPSIAIARFHR